MYIVLHLLILTDLKNDHANINNQQNVQPNSYKFIYFIWKTLAGPNNS